jgi:hypothetical protein
MADPPLARKIGRINALGIACESHSSDVRLQRAQIAGMKFSKQQSTVEANHLVAAHQLK